MNINEKISMNELVKWQLVNSCETIEELQKVILEFSDPETGMIQGRRREFIAKRMSDNVKPVVESDFPATLLTREYGIRQQALYLKYSIEREK